MSRPDGRTEPPDLHRIRVHPRTRLVLLEEIAADVDAMEEELAARGIPRGQARAAAIARLYPGPEAARELEVDHAAYRRFAERVGGARLARLERWGLGAVGVLSMAALALGPGRLDVLRTAGPFLWGTILAISLLIANTVRVAFCLWVRQDMTATARRNACRVQFGLVLLAGSLSLAGATAEAYLTAGEIAVRPDMGAVALMVRDVGVLLALGLCAVVVGLTGWQALAPSLNSYEVFERRLAGAFRLPGPRLHESGSTDPTGRSLAVPAGGDRESNQTRLEVLG